MLQIEVGVCETDICTIHNDIEGRERGDALFERIELISTREGSVWNEERRERIRAISSMLWRRRDRLVSERRCFGIGEWQMEQVFRVTCIGLSSQEGWLEVIELKRRNRTQKWERISMMELSRIQSLDCAMVRSDWMTPCSSPFSASEWQSWKERTESNGFTTCLIVNL